MFAPHHTWGQEHTHTRHMELGCSLLWAGIYVTLVTTSQEQLVINTSDDLLQASGRRAISNFRVEPYDKTLRKVSQWARMTPGWLGLFFPIPQQPESTEITVLGSVVSIFLYFQSPQFERTTDQGNSSIHVQFGGTMTP